MSTNQEHRLPPLTMSQYITGGVLLILLEFLFIVLSNEADIILEDSKLRWYFPFDLMRIADKQMRANKGNFEVKQIDIQKTDRDSAKSDLVHMFVIDQTTPKLNNIGMEQNFKAFMTPDLLFEQSGMYYPSSIARKIVDLSPQNMASFYLFSRCMKDIDQFHYAVYDYQGMKMLQPRKEPGEVMHQFDRGITNKSRAVSNFLGEYNYKVSDFARTDFQELFITIKEKYKNDISVHLDLMKHKIILNLVSDFNHAGTMKGEAAKPLKTVLAEFNELMNVCDRIESVNLIVLPSRLNDSDTRPMRDALMEGLSRICASRSKPMQQIHLENFLTSQQIKQAIDNLPIKPPILSPVPLYVYYPIKTKGFKQSGLCKFSFHANNIDSVTLQLKGTTGGELINSVLQIIDTTGKIITEIPSEPQTQEVKIVKSTHYVGRFPYPGTANGFSDLSLLVLSKESSTIEIIPIEFVEKMPRGEVELLGYTTSLIVLLFLYWILLLCTGYAFYRQKKSLNDYFESYFQLLAKFIHNNLSVSTAIAIALFGAISLYMTQMLMPAFSGQFMFTSVIILFVSVTFYFHLRHLYTYKNPEEKPEEKPKSKSELN